MVSFWLQVDYHYMYISSVLVEDAFYIVLVCFECQSGHFCGNRYCCFIIILLSLVFKGTVHITAGRCKYNLQLPGQHSFREAESPSGVLPMEDVKIMKANRVRLCGHISSGAVPLSFRCEGRVYRNLLYAKDKQN
ncbi:unnamed protein product [Thelazia callipaeda]|uniref:Secreted protein n=1 Tax=Thelazia callipaeda TaxID=103827 RepID=A0A0N5CU34_THECL|nr:unnamed protein product [Thelazia callipaeda]